jgi:hypothetical protein
MLEDVGLLLLRGSAPRPPRSMASGRVSNIAELAAIGEARGLRRLILSRPAYFSRIQGGLRRPILA